MAICMPMNNMRLLSSLLAPDKEHHCRSCHVCRRDTENCLRRPIQGADIVLSIRHSIGNLTILEDLAASSSTEERTM